ncbi:hypothetical protein NX059_004399 [Plenodomus lindquistii]|nr:hypothetical protein NX059_004399 [Plenodomus lindquistii]
MKLETWGLADERMFALVRGSGALSAALQAVTIILVLLFFIIATGTIGYIIVRRQTRDIHTKPIDMEMDTPRDGHHRSRKLTGHAPSPSLEHGPGPTIVSTAPIHPSPSRTVRIQAREPSEGVKVVRFTSESPERSSSLRRAMLDIGVETEVKCEKNVTEGEKATSSEGCHRKSRGYSGAWP